MTIAQDEDSCFVFGTPKKAVQPGAVQKVLPLQSIAGANMREGSDLLAVCS